MTLSPQLPPALALRTAREATTVPKTLLGGVGLRLVRVGSAGPTGFCIVKKQECCSTIVLSYGSRDKTHYKYPAESDHINYIITSTIWFEIPPPIT